MSELSRYTESSYSEHIVHSTAAMSTAHCLHLLILNNKLAGIQKSSTVGHSAPINFLGRKAQTVPITEIVRDKSMTDQQRMRSAAKISRLKSLR